MTFDKTGFTSWLRKVSCIIVATTNEVLQMVVERDSRGFY